MAGNWWTTIFFVLACCLFAYPSFAWAYPNEIGSVVYMKGTLTARIDGSNRSLETGSPVYVGDVIVSGPESQGRIKFLDESILSLMSSSRVTIEEYMFVQEEQNLLLRMGRGAFRVITGKIVEQNIERFVLETPLATLGVRGTTIGLLIYDDKETISAIEISEQRTIEVLHRYFPQYPATLSQPATAIDLFLDQPPSPPRPASAEEVQEIEEAVEEDVDEETEAKEDVEEEIEEEVDEEAGEEAGEELEEEVAAEIDEEYESTTEEGEDVDEEAVEEIIEMTGEEPEAEMEAEQFDAETEASVEKQAAPVTEEQVAAETETAAPPAETFVPPEVVEQKPQDPLGEPQAPPIREEAPASPVMP